MAAASAPSLVDINSRRKRSASGLRVLAFAEGLHGPSATALDDRTTGHPNFEAGGFLGPTAFRASSNRRSSFRLIRVEAKGRHRRVSDQYAFTKGFCKIFHVIAQMQLAKRRRHLKWTRANGSDRMTLCAPYLCQLLSQSCVAAFGADGHGIEDH